MTLSDFVAASSGRLEFKIRGMDCAEEIAILKRELAPLVGGEDRLAFDLLKAKVTVDPQPGARTTSEAIVAAIARTGMFRRLARPNAESSSPKKLVFESEEFENFDNEWRARETYEVVSPDEFVETFELAPPGQPFEIYSRTQFKRGG